MEFQRGDRVIPVNKTSRKRELDNCATYYWRVERDQKFLFINGIDDVATKKLGETCYWCNVVLGSGGDSYRHSDLVSYTEK